MIQYRSGNLFADDSSALVNTVNELGVMGKGVALQFKERFPASSREYQSAAEQGRVRVGEVFVTHGDDLLGPRWIIHFPTKKHWRSPSQLIWIRAGLRSLAAEIDRLRIRSIALPPLGCGNGGLEWHLVKRELDGALAGLLDVRVTVYQPSGDYQALEKRTGVEQLTPARALVAEMVRRYSRLALQCSILEIQKLAWFAQRFAERRGTPDPIAATFVAHTYGPYSDQLRHLLDKLDGSYLHCEKRIADARPLDQIWFDEARLPALQSYLENASFSQYARLLGDVGEFISGFESPFGLELLATVDWELSREGSSATLVDVRRALDRWPGGRSAASRKHQMFSDHLLQLALDRLRTVDGKVTQASK